MSVPDELTPFFATGEFEVTSTGLPNAVEDLEIWYSLRALCSAVLVPWREQVGSLKVTSGYRSPAVNAAVGGSSTSDHPTGRAADVVPVDVTQLEAWKVLLGMVRAGLPADQIILYPHTGHIHVAHRQGDLNRRQALIASADGSYSSVRV